MTSSNFNFDTNGTPWMLREIFISDPDGKSNHSLRATSISRMYHAKVPEKQIMERSGHLSKEGVRSYERTSTEQIQSICKTLVAPLHDSKERITWSFKRETTRITWSFKRETT